jgi:hypothetical protein
MCGQLHHPHGNAQVFAAAGALMQGQIFVFISFVTLTAAAAASERVVQCSAVQFFLLLVADMISMYLPIYLTRMKRPRNHAD